MPGLTEDGSLAAVVAEGLHRDRTLWVENMRTYREGAVEFNSAAGQIAEIDRKIALLLGGGKDWPLERWTGVKDGEAQKD